MTTCTTQGSFLLLCPIFLRAEEAAGMLQVRSLVAWVRILVAAALTDQTADLCLYPTGQHSLDPAAHWRVVTNEQDSKLISTSRMIDMRPDSRQISKMTARKRQRENYPGGVRGRFFPTPPLQFCGWTRELALQQGLSVQRGLVRHSFASHSHINL